MITQALLDVIFGVVNIVVGMLPISGLLFDLSSMSVFFDVISSVNYIIPMSVFVEIIAIVIVLQSFRIAVSLIRMLWDVLPFT